MRSLFSLAVITVTVLILQSCGKDPSGPDYSEVPAPYDTSQAVSDTTYSDGLKIYVVEKGHGPYEVTRRDQIRAFYTGRTEDGKIFDSSYANGNTFPNPFQNLTPVPRTTSSGTISPLIDGFRRGLLGMKIGEKRTIVIPPSLAYGDAKEGSSGYDLRNDTLVFDVQLAEIISP